MPVESPLWSGECKHPGVKNNVCKVEQLIAQRDEISKKISDINAGHTAINPNMFGGTNRPLTYEEAEQFVLESLKEKRSNISRSIPERCYGCKLNSPGL